MLPLHRRAVKAWQVLLGTDPIGISGLTPRSLDRARKRSAKTGVRAAGIVVTYAAGGNGAGRSVLGEVSGGGNGIARYGGGGAARLWPSDPTT